MTIRPAHRPLDTARVIAVDTGTRTYWPAIIAVASTATVAVMPGFTLGAMAGPIQADLGISRTTIGLAMSVFYAATALGSPATKRLAARFPAPAVLATSAVTAAAAAAIISQTQTLAVLFGALVVAGATNGLVQPAAGRVIAAQVPARRRSLAAGIVGAALGAATFIPGLLVTLVVEPHGWRPAMLIAALIALTVAVLAPMARTPGSSPAPAPQHAGTRTAATVPPAAGLRRALPLWALAAALSATGNNAVASYFIQLGHHAGLATTLTGKLLSASAVIAIAVRITVGLATDRAPRHNPAIVAAMMLTGAIGLALIASGTAAGFLTGAILAFSAGWGWTGLLLATTLRLVPDRAEQAGHTVQTGIYTGAAIAPFTFSALATAFSFNTASLLAAAAGLAAAALLSTGAKLLHR